MIYHGVMNANFKRPFRQFVKKAHKPLQLAIEDVVEDLCENPDLGESKIADLAGIRVYKFRFNRQEYLVAYRPPTKASAAAPLSSWSSTSTRSARMKNSMRC